MFKHHLLLIYRNFKKNKGGFLINLIGLSAGLTCTLLIYLWVNDEMGIDRFHDDSIYQIAQNEHLTDGIQTVEGTPGILAETMAKEIPEVEIAVATSPSFWLGQSKVSANHKPAIKAAGKFASADFFKVFSFPLLVGNKNDVLRGTKTVVISETIAKKLFNSIDIVGKEMVWSNTEMQAENHATISGVFRDMGTNTSEKVDFLVSYDVLLGPDGNSGYRKWTNYGPNTYVVLKKDVQLSVFNSKIENYLSEKGVMNYTLFARPFAESYLYNKFENGKVSGGRIVYVRLFSLIAVFILIIACINFMNLSTAKASRRSKEVGVKKVLGAPRGSLILQYLSESMLLTLMAVFISLLLVELLLPQFNQITGKHLNLEFNGIFFISLASMTIFTGLLSGSYPALYLSGLKPVAALKGRLQLTAMAMFTRQGLVVFQFAFSAILIISVLIVYKQIEFVQQSNPGYNRENVVYFETNGALKNKINFVIDEVKKIDGVANVSSIDRELLGDLSFTLGEFDWEGRNHKEVIKFQRADVNVDLIETMGMEMSAGRSFSSQFISDTSKIIINEAGIKAMGLKNPIGKIFKLWGNEMQIIGVVKDFHFESFHRKVGPLFMRYKPKHTNRVMVKIKAGNIKSVLEALEDFHTRHNPAYTFDYKFLKHDYQAQYIAESRVAVLSRYFALLAILISGLGLFGMASFTAERRFKEIGIRKILGASDNNVIYMLLKDFTKPVLIALIVALPLGYLLSKNWLNSFAYRTDLKLWFFLVSGFLAFFIALVTVYFQAFRAAKMNLVETIKAD
ncbi:FtsX-like permease family protein [Pedobacter insulae]|uniref:ABC-type transport system, involved in lipoprotein release, permease component n=1 Tax=Pedobacter insulae TaxID=414048 RepID=A0A1I2WWZ7_9SPHI|nr:FtsX-like permease family protein [Pedobacter insulae]SFH05828.1 ABC-type transport system, involved in lipoprotein release, permease component [Pedobacter insulae]